MSISKCDKCLSKSTDLKKFISKLIDGKNGNFCEICFSQSKEKESMVLKEVLSRG